MAVGKARTSIATSRIANLLSIQAGLDYPLMRGTPQPYTPHCVPCHYADLLCMTVAINGLSQVSREKGKPRHIKIVAYQHISKKYVIKTITYEITILTRVWSDFRIKDANHARYGCVTKQKAPLRRGCLLAAWCGEWFKPRQNRFALPNYPVTFQGYRATLRLHRLSPRKA